ncbi:MAG: protein kinase [Proteobacteria bacterium]|nr:protein kinase [Pseudomonadota bacterium]
MAVRICARFLNAVSLDNDNTMITCPKCHQELPDDARFCGNCAASIQPIADSEDDFVGKSINNKYLVKKRIASGGMGEVYLAIQKGVQQEVAIKKLHPEYNRDGEIVKRFIDEARSYGKITHPNAVKLHDLLNVNGQLCIIMEFVHGKTLTNYVESGYVFSIRQIIDISLQLADALGTVHRAGIIHRDLKTENVMLLETVTGRFSVKILDFGIAKFMDRTRERTTKEGVIVGTPEFMSPEQCYGLAVDHRADIYAFGILMFVMICNKLPFEADTSLALLQKQVDEPTPPCVRPDNSEVPAELEAIVDKCLMKSPSERYQSFEEVIADLTAVQEGKRPSIAAVPATEHAIVKEADSAAENTPVDENTEESSQENEVSEEDEPKESMHLLGSIDVSEETEGEPEFSLDGEEEGDGLVIGSISDMEPVESEESRSGHTGTILLVAVICLLIAAIALILAARNGTIDLSQTSAPEWLKPPVDEEVNPVKENPSDLPSKAIAENEVENTGEAETNPSAAVPEPPKEPEKIPASTAMTRQVLMNGILGSAMEKSTTLVNAGELESADTLLAYIDANKADMNAEDMSKFQALSEKNTQFKEILKSATKTKNGAKDGRACEPITSLQNTIPEDAVGMIEKVAKLKQSCLTNLSKVPDVL